MSYSRVPLLRGFTEIKQLFELSEQFGATICGGYARYCASPKPTDKVVRAGDVDLFPHNTDATARILDALKSMGFVVKHENEVSITMAAPKGAASIRHFPTPQIIKPVIQGAIVTLGTTEEILNNFDFTIVRAAIISPSEVLVDDEFLEDETHNVLRLKNIHCPISSTLRCCKYARKGYWMRPSEALKLFLDWNNRGPEYQGRMVELFTQSKLGRKSAENPDGMTQADIDELESLLRVD